MGRYLQNRSCRLHEIDLSVSYIYRPAVPDQGRRGFHHETLVMGRLMAHGKAMYLAQEKLDESIRTGTEVQMDTSVTILQLDHV